MEPITRTQLLSARASAQEERTRIAIREQELRGQLMGEEFYKEILRTAEVGTHTRADSVGLTPGIAYNYMFSWIKDHFPDCDVRAVVHGALSGQPVTWSVRVDWSPKAEGPLPDADLHQRRYEKETSW